MTSNSTRKIAGTLFEQFFAWRLEDTPEFATCIGKSEHGDRLESYAPASNQRRKETCLSFLQEAIMLLPKTEGSLQRNLQLFICELQSFIAGYPFSCYGTPVNYFEGPQIEFKQILSYMAKENKQDFQNIICRFKAFPEQVDQIIESMTLSIQKKTTNHSSSMANVVKQFSDLQVPVDTSDFYKPFLNLPETLTLEDRTALQQDARTALSECFLPAMERLGTFIEKEYIPACRQTVGANTLPLGDKYYQQCLNFHLSCVMTPQEIHDLGLAEVERISTDMKKVIGSLGLEMSIQEFSEKIRQDPNFFFTNSNDLLSSYREICDVEILPKLPNIFKDIPKAELKIEALPSSQSGGPLAFYLAGSADGKRPGVFYVNVGDMGSAPKYEMRSLTLHEALPGHHLQASFSIELPGMPDFEKYAEDRKYFSCPARFAMYSAYIEGWGLYCEFLGKELGVYSDPYSLFGHLSQEIFRACRLVVDTGLHAFGWSMKQAVDYMVQHTASTKENIEKEVNRYVMWPGQACAYKIGEIRIKALRAKAEKSLGTSFCLKEFHDVVLRNPGPLDILEQEVDKLIKSLA